jgi:hypothetical protein
VTIPDPVPDPNTETIQNPPVPPPVPPDVVVPPVVVTANPVVKNPWLSKTNILGVLLTIIGITTYFTVPEHTPALTVASISETIGGVAAVVLRTWYTNQPVTQFSADSLMESLSKARLGGDFAKEARQNESAG